MDGLDILDEKLDIEKLDKETFSKLFQETLNKKLLHEGEITKGRVIDITKDFVIVDIGFKSEGHVPIEEFKDPFGKIHVKREDIIDVLLESNEDEDGAIVLSKEKADKLKIWDEIARIYEKDELIEGVVTAKVKGGLSVNIGVKAFLPGSQIDLRPIRDLDKLIGQKFKFKIIKFNQKKNNIVLSRRVLLEKERDQLRSETLTKLKEGETVKGIIKNITDYGVFIDLGGIDGLLHITDISWGRVSNPREMFEIGDEIKVKVLKYNEETERVSLGLKQLSEDPWTKATAKYPVGTKVKGKVVSVTDYGAFIEIEEGIEGLIHVTEMSWNKKIKKPSKLVNLDDEIEAIVLEINQENRRISLGMKQIEPNPWEAIREKYPSGTRVKGKIKNITDFGIFVGVEEGIDGLIHISDFSWTQKIKHPSDLFQKGDEIEAVALNVDVENERFSLGIKQLLENPWDGVADKYPVGKAVKTVVKKVADFGIFVELEEGIEGLIHISELSATEHVNDTSKKFKVNDEVVAEIVSLDPQDKKIALSIKGLQEKLEHTDIDAYMAQQTESSDSKTQLGEILKESLQKKERKKPGRKKTKEETEQAAMPEESEGKTEPAADPSQTPSEEPPQTPPTE